MFCTIRSLIQYFTMLAGIFVICVLISYDNMIWLAYSVAVAGVISAVVCIFSRKNFSVSVRAVQTMCDEGGKLDLIVHIEKTGFCFIPLVEIAVYGGNSERVVAGSLLFNNSMDIPVSMTLDTCGLVVYYAEVETVHDFIEALVLSSDKRVEIEVPVKPVLNKYPFSPHFEKDDGNDSTDYSSTGFMGFPGCEVREYQDGDAPRSINYKLSAKHGKLLVRINEQSGSRNVFQLIKMGSGCNSARLALAFADHLMRMGITVTTFYCGELCTCNADDIEGLRRWLALRRFDLEPMDESDISADFVVSDRAVVNGSVSDEDVSFAYRDVAQTSDV